MFEVIAGLLIFSTVFSFIWGILGIIAYILFALLGSLVEQGEGCGCLGLIVAMLVSLYCSYVFTIEALVRLSI